MQLMFVFTFCNQSNFCHLKTLKSQRVERIQLDEDFFQMRPAFEGVDKEDADEEEGWRKEGEVEDEDGKPKEDEEDSGADDHGDKHVTHGKPDQG